MEDYPIKRVKSLYLIGDPIDHSISPQIHNAALKYHKIPYIYKSCKISLCDLPKFLLMCKKEAVIGFNITIPLKTEILRYLDDISPIARKIGAINTVKIENGKLSGINTDVAGIQQAIKISQCPYKSLKNIVILGAGGAARSVAHFFSAYRVNIIIINRTLQRAEFVRNGLIKNKEIKASIQINSLDTPQRISILSSANLLINTTPIGMWPNIMDDPLPDYIPKKQQWVFDLVYNPLETPFVHKAKQIGCKLVSGLDMLIYQSAESFKWWTGIYPNVEVMKKTAIDTIKSIFSDRS